jgi:hypothetical protein
VGKKMPPGYNLPVLYGPQDTDMMTDINAIAAFGPDMGAFDHIILILGNNQVLDCRVGCFHDRAHRVKKAITSIMPAFTPASGW